MSKHDPEHEELLLAVVAGDVPPNAPEVRERTSECATCAARLARLRSVTQRLDAEAPEELASLGLAPDRFGTLARTKVLLPAGRWTIETTSDDGLRVFVDDDLLIDDWTWHAPKRIDAELTLDRARTVEIRVLDHDDVAARAREARAQRGALAAVAGVFDQTDRSALGDLAQTLDRAVTRRVVHDDDLLVERDRLHALQDLVDRLDLVVGGDDDRNLHVAPATENGRSPRAPWQGPRASRVGMKAMS